jgi:hypothetical protein
MERPAQPGGPSNMLFFLMAAIIVAAILIFVIFRPGHA